MAVLLDRDGTINHERSDYVLQWEQFEFLPGALEAMRLLAMTPFPLVVVTNQSAVGRGIITIDALERLHERMRDGIVSVGGRLDGVFVCVHAPDDGCACRKPRSANLEAALRFVDARAAESVFVGNSETDVAAAVAAGVQPVLLVDGVDPHRRGDVFLAPDLLAVARLLANAEACSSRRSAAGILDAAVPPSAAE